MVDLRGSSAMEKPTMLHCRFACAGPSDASGEKNHPSSICTHEEGAHDAALQVRLRQWNTCMVSPRAVQCPCSLQHGRGRARALRLLYKPLKSTELALLLFACIIGAASCCHSACDTCVQQACAGVLVAAFMLGGPLLTLPSCSLIKTFLSALSSSSGPGASSSLPWLLQASKIQIQVSAALPDSSWAARRQARQGHRSSRASFPSEHGGLSL